MLRDDATPSDLRLAATTISGGGFAIVPTRRWYMVCCDARRDDLCDEIYRAKRRPPDRSLLLVPESVETARRLFEVPADAESLITALWPGDLALRLRWRPETKVIAGVAFPTSLVCISGDALGDLATTVGAPLAATSVNVSVASGGNDRGPALSREEVEAFLAESGLDVQAIVDGGICPAFEPLTIVDCRPNAPCVVERRGVVHERAISLALGTVAPMP